MNITVQEVVDRQQWNAFLAQSDQGHILQSYEWGELSLYLGGRLYRLGALDEQQQMVGAMMLVEVPVALPGLRLKWLYSARGPAVTHDDALVHLISYAHDLARRERAITLRIEPNVADNDTEQDRWLATYRRLGFSSNPISVHGRRSWVLDISPTSEQLLANFKMTWRQNVRVAERKGVVIREVESDADFDAYYNLLSITSERDAFFIHGKEYHREILRQYAETGNLVLFLAEHEGQALATKMLICLGDWCWDMFGGSGNEKRNLKATYLLQYRCIQWAQARGCRYFDFRVIPEVLEPGEDMWGVYEYKRGFGGFSRLNLPTQDYVYRPLIYTAWRKLVEVRRERRHRERLQVELDRAARGKNGTEKKPQPQPDSLSKSSSH